MNVANLFRKINTEETYLDNDPCRVIAEFFFFLNRAQAAVKLINPKAQFLGCDAIDTNTWC